MIRALNDRRKAEGLEISDRIVAWLAADGDVAEAVGPLRDWIAGEVLARELHLVDAASAGPADGFTADRRGRHARPGEDRAGLIDPNRA